MPKTIDLPSLGLLLLTAPINSYPVRVKLAANAPREKPRHPSRLRDALSALHSCQTLVRFWINREAVATYPFHSSSTAARADGSEAR